MKICRTCNQEKANNKFGVNNQLPDNLQRVCKQCDSERRKKNYDPEKARRSWKRNKYSTPEFAEDRRLRQSYGITKDFRDFMAAKQDKKCAICNTVAKLVVDHDHESGIVRGLLCSRCNLGIGGFDDNEEKVKNAYLYLNDFNEKQSTEFS